MWVWVRDYQMQHLSAIKTFPFMINIDKVIEFFIQPMHLKILQLQKSSILFETRNGTIFIGRIS